MLLRTEAPSTAAMLAAGAIAAIGPGADVEDGTVTEPRADAGRIFHGAAGRIEFEAPISCQHLPDLIDMGRGALVFGKRIGGEVSDGDRRTEYLGTAIDVQEGALQ